MNLQSSFVMACVLLVAAPGLRAQETRPSGDAFTLTIYSAADPSQFSPTIRGEGALPGYGVVRQRRNVELTSGVSDVVLTGVAAGIDPTTVAFKSLTAPEGTSVLEQNFEYDLASPDKMLEKYVGSNILINRKPAPSVEGGGRVVADSREGRLLAFDKDHFVIESRNRQMPVEVIPRNQDIGEIKLFNLETGLVTRPTLRWKVQAEQAGKHDVELTYQTDGLTWRADYNLLVSADDTRADLGAWVSIINESGLSYPNASVKLVAGDVGRIVKPWIRESYSGGYGGSGGDQFTSQKLFEYHLYTLQRATTLPDRSTKQIELFPTRSNVGVKKTLVYRTLSFVYPFPLPRDLSELETSDKEAVTVVLSVDNSEKNGLGLPLPAGRVRSYKRDPVDGTPEFIGEATIKHTALGRTLDLEAGTAFDLTGQAIRTSSNLDREKHTLSETFEVTLHNGGKQPATIIVRHPIRTGGKLSIQENGEKYEQKATDLDFPVTVPALSDKTIRYTTYYTW